MRVGILIVAVALLVGLADCGSSRSTTPAIALGRGAPPEVKTDRFPHEKHTSGDPRYAAYNGGKGLGCVDCHDAASVIAGKISRPGARDHAPCDDEQCHRKEFAKEPGPLCRVCHASVDPTTEHAAPLQTYPERGTTQVLSASFSHRQHLDRDTMEHATGAHVACTDCHARNDAKEPILPGHAQCAPCHDRNPGVKAQLAMEKCAGCHPQKSVDLRRGRLFITGDLKFSHATHVTDRKGATVPCIACHDRVAEASSRTENAVPTMERCAQCHEDSDRTPDRVRMANCAVCHAAPNLAAAPANHMVGAKGARPADHTLDFRKNHGARAGAKDAQCSRCHQHQGQAPGEVQGAPEDSCFQCHQVMRPQDHNLMFRDDHGREAQADSARCAQCHQPETCVACHSVPPRSHTPLAEFRLGGHAQQARFGLTACLTCHTFETTCAQCHRGTR